MSLSSASLPRWAWIYPVLAWLVLGLSQLLAPSLPFLVLVGVILGSVVFAAVHHAEVIAHRIGEPFGTLVLAVAVTVIEVALIVSVMLSGGPEKAGLARDTVYAAVMIVCNGIVGICLLIGGWQHREQGFHIFGASAAMGVLTVLAVSTLVLPNFTRTTEGPMLATSQLAFVGITSLVLYCVFVFIQTVRHRDYFIVAGSGDDHHAPPPPTRTALFSLGLLMVCLVAVVLLAKLLSPAIEAAVARAGAPAAVVGIVIAALVLLPESLAALRAARANRLQTSINLALGSALASIGLTIPTVAAVFIYTEQPLLLGLAPKEMVMLALTLLVGGMTLATGRTTIMQGAVHLVIFAAFLFLSIVP